MAESNEYVRKVAEEKYKYGFTTDIHTEIIDKGLNRNGHAFAFVVIPVIDVSISCASISFAHAVPLFLKVTVAVTT